MPAVILVTRVELQVGHLGRHVWPETILAFFSVYVSGTVFVDATNSTKEGVLKCAHSNDDARRGGIYWYASYADMASAVKATATASEPTVAYFNDCWDLTNGYPVWKNLPKVQA